MKHYKEAISLSDALNDYVKITGKMKGIENAQVISAWGEVMGNAIVSRTDKISFYKGTLYIKLNSAPLKQDLVLSREKLVARINEHLGSTLVMNINIG